MKTKKDRSTRSSPSVKAGSAPAPAKRTFTVDESKLQKIAGGRLSSN